MPVKVKKIGKFYYAVDNTVKKAADAPKGRKHTTKADAVAQVQAINLSMIRSGKLKIKPKKGK